MTASQARRRVEALRLEAEREKLAPVTIRNFVDALRFASERASDTVADINQALTLKSAVEWNRARLWCLAHPGQHADIVTPVGTYTLTFDRKPGLKGQRRMSGYPTKDGVSATQHARDRARAATVLGRPLKRTEEVHHHSPTQIVVCQDHAYHGLLHKRRHDWLMEHDDGYIMAEVAKMEAETERVREECRLMRLCLMRHGFTAAELDAVRADRIAISVRPA